MVKCLPAIREIRLRSLGQEDPLEKEMATHSSTLAWMSYMESLVAQRLKRLPGMWETQVQSLGREDPLDKEMVTHSSTLA